MKNGLKDARSMNSEEIQKVRSKALRCRELSNSASDPEVKQELQRVAAELETALLVLEDERSKCDAALREDPAREAVSDSALKPS
jgi:hypothetical protein